MADQREVKPFPISPELMAWLQQRADERHHSSIAVTIRVILEQARDDERAERANRVAGGTKGNADRGTPTDDPWADLQR